MQTPTILIANSVILLHSRKHSVDDLRLEFNYVSHMATFHFLSLTVIMQFLYASPQPRLMCVQSICPTMGGPSELRPSVAFSPSCLDPVVYLYNFQWACWLVAEVFYLESFCFGDGIPSFFLSSVPPYWSMLIHTLLGVVA